MQNLNDRFRQYSGGGHAYEIGFISTAGIRAVANTYGLNWLWLDLLAMRNETPGGKSRLVVFKITSDFEKMTLCKYLNIRMSYVNDSGQECERTSSLRHYSGFPAESELTVYLGVEDIFCLPSED
jgi:hypothetical protein